jgi:prophage tail gpP-like protein
MDDRLLVVGRETSREPRDPVEVPEDPETVLMGLIGTTKVDKSKRGRIISKRGRTWAIDTLHSSTNLQPIPKA